MIGYRHHFIRKKPPSIGAQTYNNYRMSGSSPYTAVEIDICLRSPAENSGMRRNDFNTGGARHCLFDAKVTPIGKL